MEPSTLQRQSFAHSRKGKILIFLEWFLPATAFGIISFFIILAANGISPDVITSKPKGTVLMVFVCAVWGALIASIFLKGGASLVMWWIFKPTRDAMAKYIAFQKQTAEENKQYMLDRAKEFEKEAEEWQAQQAQLADL